MCTLHGEHEGHATPGQGAAQRHNGTHRRNRTLLLFRLGPAALEQDPTWVLLLWIIGEGVDQPVAYGLGIVTYHSGHLPPHGCYSLSRGTFVRRAFRRWAVVRRRQAPWMMGGSSYARFVFRLRTCIYFRQNLLANTDSTTTTAKNLTNRKNFATRARFSGSRRPRRCGPPFPAPLLADCARVWEMSKNLDIIAARKDCTAQDRIHCSSGLSKSRTASTSR